MFDYDNTRHKAWYNQEETDRPVYGINVGFWASQRYPRTMAAIPDGQLRPEDIRTDLYLEDCDDLYEIQKGMGDYPFVCAAFPAMCWMEAIVGCPIFGSQESSSCWSEPMISNWGEYDYELPDLNNNPWMDKLLEMCEALVKNADGRYQLAPTLMRGTSDILSGMRGGSTIPLDFLDDPETIQRAAKICADLHIAVGKAQLDIIPTSKQGYIAGDAALKGWSPKKQIWLQEDAMALMDPTIYTNIFLPLDKYIADSYPSTIFHMHGTALWGIDELAQVPSIYAIELNLEDASCDVEGTWAGWKKIQQHKPVVIWRVYHDDFEPWLRQILLEFPYKGLSIQVSTGGMEEAQKARDVFDKLFAELT